LDLVLFYLPADHSFPSVLEFFKLLLVSLPFGPLWEEIAWRAFALRKLESRYSALVSAVIIGVYWAVWHIPLWVVQLQSISINKTPILLTASVNLVAWSITWTYIYQRSSQSLPVVILLHSTYGAVTDQIVIMVPHLNLYVIYVSAVLSVCLATLFAGKLKRGRAVGKA
jgi:membrane protease YdiL (CAAX protease family)